MVSFSIGIFPFNRDTAVWKIDFFFFLSVPLIMNERQAPDQKQMLGQLGVVEIFRERIDDKLDG